MHPTIEAVQAGLAYARFSNPTVRRKTMTLLNRIGEDLDESYEEGDDVVGAVDELNETLNELDESREKLEEAIENAEPEKEEG